MCWAGPWGKAVAAGGGRPRCLLSRDRPRDRLRDPDDDVGLRPWPTAPPMPRLAMLLLRYIWGSNSIETILGLNFLA